MKSRDYDAIAGRIRAEVGLASRCGSDSETTEKSGVFGVHGCARADFVDDMTLRIVVDALWGGLQGLGISWVGFYDFHPKNPAHQAMTLGPSRDTPACSPIGLHGVCGQALTGRKTMIVRDVEDLGEGYVACDPRDRSEIVLPCFADLEAGLGKGSGPWGVLDLDSHEVGAFDGADELGLVKVLAAAGIGVVG